jgi:predicted Holliday junction resolvase-like endonuclease
MIYAIVILSFVLLVAVLWILQLRDDVKNERKDVEYRKQQINKLRENCNELHEEIWILIDGGMIQQETVIMKYRKQREEVERSRKMAMDAAKRNSSGLSALGGMGDFMQPFRR